MVRVYALLHVLVSGVDLGWQLPPSGAAAGAFALLALVAAGTALAWIAVRCRHAQSPRAGETDLGRGMHRCPEWTVVLPVRAPDTPGRPLPRAPGTGRAAA